MVIITEETPEQLIPSLAEVSDEYYHHINPNGEEGGLVHETAHLGQDVRIKLGSVVMENANVRDGAVVGEGVIINPGAWVCRKAYLPDNSVVAQEHMVPTRS